MNRLRPFAFALGFLLLVELLLRCVFAADERVLLDARNPFGCFADDPLYRLQKARELPEPALDVVLLGDSVLASVENGPGERLTDFLPGEVGRALADSLHGKKVRAWSISNSAARAADQLAALKILHARLTKTSKGLRDLVVVISSNPLFFSRRFASDAMNYPCLSYALADDPLLLRKLNIPSPSKGLWGDSDAYLGTLFSHLYLFQQRRNVAEKWVGGPLRPRLRELVTHGVRRLSGQKEWQVVVDEKTRNRPWFQRDHKRDSFSAHYDFLKSDSPAAWNWTATRALFSYLHSHPELATLVMINPHNHFFIGPLGDTDGYRTLIAQLAQEASRQGVFLADYDRNPALQSEHFLDIDHFTRDGNLVLSSLIAGDVAKRVAGN